MSLTTALGRRTGPAWAGNRDAIAFDSPLFVIRWYLVFGRSECMKTALYEVPGHFITTVEEPKYGNQLLFHPFALRHFILSRE